MMAADRTEPRQIPTVLVAGIGNIFLGDDAFGVEVARSLLRRPLPEFVSVRDFGIRGFDLAYSLLDPWKAVILVDALPRGEAPGTLFVMEPNSALVGASTSPDMAFNAHGMDPVRVLNLAASIGSISAEIFIVGCEPHDFGDELEGRMGLSAPVQAVVEEASDMVERLIDRILQIQAERPHQLEATER
jgi:hydrogenase maturation protease